jgi:hypothetical protein
MTIKTLKAAGGHFVKVEAELDDHYVVNYVDKVYGQRDPFVIRKDNENYTEEPFEPQAGDILTYSLGEGDDYRVLGVAADGSYMLIIRAEAYADGEWPVPKNVQSDAFLDWEDIPFAGRPAIYVRKLPDHSYVLKSRL